MMENTVVPKGNAWTNFVKDWTAKHDTTYMVAIKDPVVSQAYKDSKKTKRKLVIVDNFEKLKGDAVAMAEAIDPPAEKKKAGRPSKYANDEERKEAKRLKTLASNKKKREEMSKKNKEGTMTALEKSNWEHDTELNVARTIEYRVRKRATDIVKYEKIFNKLVSYMRNNEEEFFENWEKDPYDIYYGYSSKGNNFTPKGKYQERANELFGQDWKSYSNEIERKALTAAEYDFFADPNIPNWIESRDQAQNTVRQMRQKIEMRAYAVLEKEKKKRGKETKGMTEDDPYEKRRIEEEVKRVEKEKKDREAARDKAEKDRRAAETPAQRRAEELRVKALYARFGITGRGRGGAIERDSNWISLVDNGFWN